MAACVCPLFGMGTLHTPVAKAKRLYEFRVFLFTKAQSVWDRPLPQGRRGPDGGWVGVRVRDGDEGPDGVWDGGGGVDGGGGGEKGW